MKLKYLFLFASPLVILSGCSRADNPNVILFLVDDLGWTDLGCYGSDMYQNPNVDKLASEGMRFTSAYSSCTVCSPTRASIMTGKYPAALRCTDFISGHVKPFAKYSPPDWTKYLDLEEYTLASAMRNAGYKTIHLGKWHLGEDEKFWPEKQGFEINIGGWKAGQPLKAREGCEGYFSPWCNPRLENGADGDYLTERLSEEAVNFIKNRKGKKEPFFINFWFYNVHTPLQAREEKIEKYRQLIDSSHHHTNPVYAAMIEHMDDAVGIIMSVLKEEGFDDNTIIFFTSDNGGLMNVTSNYPLRNGKGDLFEGGVRVPFIARWNKKIKAGTLNHNPVISMDIYPTILGLTHVQGNASQNAKMDGIDISSTLLHQKPPGRETLFWHYPHYHPGGALPYSAIRKENWKLIEIFEHDTPMLFNLENDIGEESDLYSKNPEKAAELLTELKNWRLKVKAQMPVDNLDYYPEYHDKFKPGGVWNQEAKMKFLEMLKKQKSNL